MGPGPRRPSAGAWVGALLAVVLLPAACGGAADGGGPETATSEMPAPATSTATSTTEPATSTTAPPTSVTSTTTTTPGPTVDWTLIEASRWLIYGPDGITDAVGRLIWQPEVVLGVTDIVRDGLGGFAWVDVEGLWWLPYRAPRPVLVREGAAGLLRAVPADGRVVALVWEDADLGWIDLETGEDAAAPDVPGMRLLDDVFAPVWVAANGLEAVVTPPDVVEDAEGFTAEVLEPSRLVVSYAGESIFDIVIGTLEAPWGVLHDFDGRRLVVSRWPEEPALPEVNVLVIDLGCGECFRWFPAAASSAVLVGVDTYEVVTEVDRQPSMLLAAWPGTDEGVTELGDGVYLGFLDLDRTDTDRLTFDLAVWFFGADADRAASYDGETDVPVPNDVYIRNLDDRTFTFPVSPGVEVTAVWHEGGPESEQVPYEDLLSALRSPQDAQQNMAGDPWWITIENGQVVRIEEQYVP